MTAACKKLIIYCLLVTGYLLLATKVNAQIFTLTPSTDSKPVDQEFTVNLGIDTQNNAVMSADVKLTFNSAVLDIVKVDNGDFFPEVANYIGSGTLTIGGYFQQQFATKTGQGNLATITLKGKSAGTASLTFVCSQDTTDSNIYNASGTDIINCSGTTNGSYTVTSGGGTQPTSTPVPTATVPPGNTPAPTSTPTPRPVGGGNSTPQPTMAVPVSGNLVPTAIFGISGILLTILGIALIL